MTEFGEYEPEQVRRLRAACFAYTSLILVHTACGEPPTPEEAGEINGAFAALACAGHALVEAAKARAN